MDRFQFGSGGGGGQSCKEQELLAEEGEWKRVVIKTEKKIEAHIYYCVHFIS
jgi:hypothetical protein